MAVVYPVAPGFPNTSGIMIPAIWSGKILRNLYAATVVAAIAQTDYEGEIKGQGDTVHIRTTPVISISNHVKGQKLVYETPEVSLVDLLINNGKSWSFISDDVDRHQADYNYVSNWTADAAERLKIAIDTDVLANIYSQAHASNKGLTAGAISGNVSLGVSGTPLSIDKTTVLDFIIDAGQVLDEQNVAESGRYLVLPAWAAAMIKKSDLKDASLAGDGTSVMRNGRIGMIDRFEIYASNLLHYQTDTVKTFDCPFGQKIGLTFATQLIENEGPMRSPDFFGDLYRGLNVYGYKVVKPEAVGWAYLTKG